MKNFVSICTNRKGSYILTCGSNSKRDVFLYFHTKESAPNVKVPIIYVSIPYAGISPEDAINLLVKPIEKSFRTIKNVKKLPLMEWRAELR